MAHIETYSENTKSMLNLLYKDAGELIRSFRAKTSEKMNYWAYTILFSPQPKTKGSSHNLGLCGFVKEKGMYYITLSDNLLSPMVTYNMVREVLGHEVAHYIDWNINGSTSHGEEFKRICAILGITNDEAVFKDSLMAVRDNSSIMEKIKKLLALSESPNMNEAQSALLKARQLMREYNLEDAERKDTQKIYRLGLHDYKSYTAELMTITYIIKQVSNVYVVLNGGYPLNTISAHGTKTEVEIAEYLFSYLKRELDYQYKQMRKNGDFYGRGKTSFYNGVLSEMQKRFSKQEENSNWGLVEYNKENEKLARNLVYSDVRLKSKVSHTRVSNSKAYNSGKETGKNLRIHNGLSNGSSQSGRYLG